MSKKLEPVLTIKKNELPQGWELATISDLVGNDGVFVDGDWVESKDQDPEGDVRLIQLADIGDGSYRDKSARFLTSKNAKALRCTFLEKGDVLVARMPDPLGRACIFPGDKKRSVTVVDVAVVRAWQHDFNHRWLMYFMNAPAFRSVVASLQSGSTRKRISRKNLSSISLPVPPREQQDRIVAEIEKQFSRLDEAVANLKRVKANLKRYKAAVLKAAVKGKLTEEWRKSNPDVEPADKLLERILKERRVDWQGKGKYKEPIGPDVSGLPELPKGWVWAALGQLIDVPNYGTSKKCDYDSGSIGVLRIPNIASGLIDASDLKSADFNEKEKRAYTLKAGDLLTIRSNGSVSLVGKCALVRDEDTKFLYAGYLIRLRPSTEGIASEYLMACFSSQILRRQIEAKAKSTSGVNNINSGELQSLILPLCCMDEQHQIIAEVECCLSIIDGAEAQVNANLRRADRLRQSILKVAFSGKLVPQNPNDEPASALLDRIRSQIEGKTKPDGKTKARKSGRISKVKSEKVKKPLLDVIRKNPAGITPETLLAEANYSLDDIGIFYEQLALIRDLIEQEKPCGEKAYQWPESPLVILKPKGA